jgi:colanic acid biosynthesis glycosyl transferase WcaI
MRPDGSPLHIGYLVQQFPPEVGAGPARVLEMARRWRDRGARVTVYTGMPNRPQGRIAPEYRGRLACREEWEGLEVYRSWLFASPTHGFARTVANNLSFMATGGAQAALRGDRPDVLIASSPPFFVLGAGRVAARLRRIPLVLELRDLWPDYLRDMGVLGEGLASRALFRMEERLLRKADRVVVVSEPFREAVVGKGVSPDRVEVITNGVDAEQYRPAEEAAPLAELGRANGEFVVGYLGNFGACQRLETLVRAAKVLEGEERPFRFVLAGDGTERARVDAEVRRLRPDGLHLAGPVAKDRTRAFYNACDAFVVPLAPLGALESAIPSKLFEVMACGVPVAGSVSGESARLVRESRGGVVSPAGDADGLADSLRRLAAMPARQRREMGMAGRAYVQARFDRIRLADRYLEVLREVARQGRHA